MLELILVFVILGVLVAIFLPKFNFSLNEARKTTLQADFALLQNALALHKNDIFLGQSTALNLLDEAAILKENEALFYCTSEQISKCNGGQNCCTASLLVSPLYSSKKGWIKTGANSYSYFLGKDEVGFEFKNGEFVCLKNCEFLR